MTPLLAVALNRVDLRRRAVSRPRAQTAPSPRCTACANCSPSRSSIVVAYVTRDATMTIVALAVASLSAAIAVQPAAAHAGRGPAAGERAAEIVEFLVYAKPIVASLVIYQLIALINRQVALDHLGAVATGKLSLATDLGQRLFQAANTLPELLLFQYALERERAEGRAAAERQIGVNMALCARRSGAARRRLHGDGADLRGVGGAFRLSRRIRAADAHRRARLPRLLHDLVGAQSGLPARQAHLAGDAGGVRRIGDRSRAAALRRRGGEHRRRWRSPMRSASVSASASLRRWRCAGERAGRARATSS